MAEIENNEELQNEEIQIEQNPNCDWFLQNVINFANNFGMEFGVVLYVGGLLVSGTVISGRKYFEIFSEQFSEGFKQEGLKTAVDALSNSIKRYGEIYPDLKALADKKRESDEEFNLMSADTVAFIHLKDVSILAQTGTPMKMNNTLWRGKLDSIDGFHMGSIGEIH